MDHVRGKFDVKPLPQPPEADPGFAAVSRLLLDKRYYGALDGVAHGQMLAVGGEGGWGVYVAIEKFEGALQGRRGSFILYHAGTMTPEDGQKLEIQVAPQSGTGELAGISGRLAIEIVDGGHFYDFEYGPA